MCLRLWLQIDTRPTELHRYNNNNCTQKSNIYDTPIIYVYIYKKICHFSEKNLNPLNRGGGARYTITNK